jgi:hypothetical protein
MCQRATAAAARHIWSVRLRRKPLRRCPVIQGVQPAGLYVIRRSTRNTLAAVATARSIRLRSKPLRRCPVIQAVPPAGLHDVRRTTRHTAAPAATTQGRNRDISGGHDAQTYRVAQYNLGAENTNAFQVQRHSVCLGRTTGTRPPYTYTIWARETHKLQRISYCAPGVESCLSKLCPLQTTCDRIASSANHDGGVPASRIIGDWLWLLHVGAEVALEERTLCCAWRARFEVKPKASLINPACAHELNAIVCLAVYSELNVLEECLCAGHCVLESKLDRGRYCSTWSARPARFRANGT